MSTFGKYALPAALILAALASPAAALAGDPPALPVWGAPVDVEVGTLIVGAVADRPGRGETASDRTLRNLPVVYETEEAKAPAPKPVVKE